MLVLDTGPTVVVGSERLLRLAVMSSERRFHKPVRRPNLDGSDSRPGPAEQSELAHELAGMVISDRSRKRDSASTERFVRLADEHGLEQIAQLWARSPAVSLPGALWRLYALRTWIRRRGAEASRWYRTGLADGAAAVSEAIAGAPPMPTPDELADVVDEIMRGAFRGDFAIALERASAFVSIVTRGRADDDADDSSLRSFAQMSDDLRICADQFRKGRLV